MTSSACPHCGGTSVVFTTEALGITREQGIARACKACAQVGIGPTTIEELCAIMHDNKHACHICDKHNKQAEQNFTRWARHVNDRDHENGKQHGEFHRETERLRDRTRRLEKLVAAMEVRMRDLEQVVLPHLEPTYAPYGEVARHQRRCEEIVAAD